ncbi:MAG: hypothetical protein F6J87_24875 [Spirulina sp. SIO3F2]|nr:hypothetical protein [Spirulina sp. SIO3F2]
MLLLCWGLVACGGSSQTAKSLGDRSLQQEAIAETAPPLSIRTLQPKLAAYQPQVQILTPQPNEILSQTQVAVTVTVQDLPIFKDEEHQLGPHLQVSLDNQPARSVYSLDAPIMFEDVTPGTHLLRIFVVTPWGESFKNEGAYAQTQFAVLTPDRNHRPDPNLPLLTYNSPEGLYSAQPLLLDFFLTNAPLQWSETAALDPASTNWRIRVTANAQSFILDDWQPLYLEGFRPGLNWVKLEFLGPNGQPIDNVFNNMVRMVNYQPEEVTPLAALVTNAIPTSEQMTLIDPTYRDRVLQPATLENEIETEPSIDSVPIVEPSTELSPIEEIITTQDPEINSEPAPTEPIETQQLDDEAIPLETTSDIGTTGVDSIEPSTNTQPAPEEVTVPEEIVIVNEALEMPLILDAQGIPVIVPDQLPLIPSSEVNATSPQEAVITEPAETSSESLADIIEPNELDPAPENNGL